MGRIRTIKPELIANTKFASLSDGAARLFYALYSLVDDAGHCPSTPGYLAGQVFFAKPRGLNVIARLLAELVTAGFVVTYEAEGLPYLEIVGWLTGEGPTSQRIDKPQKPHYPLPSWFHSRNGSANDSTNHSRTDPTSDLRPATAEGEGDREERSLSLPGAGRDGLGPPWHGEGKETKAEIAARMSSNHGPNGILTAAEVVESIKSYDRTSSKPQQQPQRDLELAKWIARERPRSKPTKPKQPKAISAVRSDEPEGPSHLRCDGELRFYRHPNTGDRCLLDQWHNGSYQGTCELKDGAFYWKLIDGPSPLTGVQLATMTPTHTGELRSKQYGARQR